MVFKSMYFFKAFAFACFALFFVSCSSVTQYPSWYLDTNKDDSYLSGVGSSKNLQDAKLEALNDIASQISLNIESDINISKEQKNDNLSSSVSSNIGINISDIELDSLEYPMIEEVNGTFFVQAKIKKSAVISKLNANINYYTNDINSILNSIRDSKCSTLSPKHKYHLSSYISHINSYVKQINALNGTIENEKMIDSVNKVLANQPLAYYMSFVQGGKGNDYSLIESSLLSEYNKFFNIKNKNSSIYYIENNYKVKHSPNSLDISLHTSIRDCASNVIFDTSIEASDDSRDIALSIERLKAQLYKKLQSWIENK